METRCQHWLPKKNRFCANTRFTDSLFCGNHNQRPDEQWIPCPIDPSHSVLEDNLKGHLGRCPFLKQAQYLTLQPFYHKGINGSPTKQDEALVGIVTSEMKRNAVYSMPVLEFLKLISKIKYIHSTVCKDIQYSLKMPEACNVWIKREVDRKLPFKEKHVLQQASILGNLEDFGVLHQHSLVEVGREDCCSDGSSGDDNGVPAVVEFGAGRGYLTQMLADCYGIDRVYLVERKSYKLKADRSLRQKDSLVLERLRIDIEDLDLNAVESLRGLPYLAIGKHLCGPATDLTLQCCLGRRQCHQYSSAQCGTSPCLKGLAIATCCHHLCQWKQSPVTFPKAHDCRIYLSNLGITEEDFHSITWFTSWAVDADHSSDIPDDIDFRLHLPTMEEKELLGDSGGVEEIARSMKAVERAVLGFMCKEIIDQGRLMWIEEECGLDTKLAKYVPASISPENHLLIARSTSNA